MQSPEYYAYTVKLLMDGMQRKEEVTASDLESWLNLCTGAITALENLMATKLTNPQKKKCQTSMTHLLTIQCKLNNQLKTGGRLQQNELEPVNNERVQWDDFESAFEKRVRSGVISNLGHLDIVAFMDDAQKVFELKIVTALSEYNALKINAELSAEYTVQKNDSVVAEVKYFSTENVAIYQTTDIKQWFDENIKQVILREMEEFEQKGSGWSLRQILNLAININKLNPVRGSSYIPLPKFIQDKKACVNVQNNDQQCFKWAVLSALHPVDRHSYRVCHYEDFEGELNFTGIDFPVPIKQVAKFEKLNNISINVYILKKSGSKYTILPCHVTSLKQERHVNLLLIQDFYVDDEEEGEEDGDSTPKFHYVWIKNLSRLVRSQVSKHNARHHICDRCLHFFNDEQNFKAHEMDCQQINKCKIQLPLNNDNILLFRNFNNKTKVPFIIYADLECLLKPVDDDTRVYQRHQAYSIGYYVKCSFDDERCGYYSYRQEEDGTKTPAEWFIEKLRALADELIALHANPKPMQLTREDKEDFQNAKICHICNKSFSASAVKVRDHCHLTGKYRGAAHEGCNINFQDARFIPVVFHNLTGYDSHFIIKELATAENFKGRVQLIAENKERYISFTKHVEGSDVSFRFIDSFRFMPSSLEKLSSYLDQHDITTQVFQKSGYTGDQVKLLLRKGVFPYDYVSSFEKLEDKELPTKEDFYNKLNESEISEDDYRHARNVWETLKIETLGEYSDVYLKTDVLLLADVFENFRSTCMLAYGLDPAHYYTTPGLTWDAMLKYTNVKLELLTDIDMLMFIERGIRGGVSQCSNRYAKANNKYMDDYNPQEEDKYLMYFDANNLYGWAMTQYLPTGDFKWLNVDNTRFDYNVADNSNIGFIYEVDLEYPPSIHDYHKDLPLCPEHRAPPGSKQEKLLTTLDNKKRYVIHYIALKQAIKHGLVVKKVHRVLQFQQSPWLKPYVDLNTDKRKQSKNEFEKLFFKLMINAVYGKTMENERKRVDIKLVNKWSGRYGAEALIASPNFHSRTIFDENLVAVQLARTQITIRKPIYVGLSVLDISKTLIYDFHYSYMKERVGDKCKLLYTDTDSLIYEIKDVNVYDMMKSDIEKFDTSDYPEDNQFGLPRVNKKVIGLMKDECGGNIMTEFIGLRSKMYAVRIQNENPIKKAKGVKTAVVKTCINFEDYHNCLFDKTIIRCQQNNIRSSRHNVQTEHQSKIALSPHDDKRHLLANSTDTLPWGHYKILGESEVLEMVEEWEMEEVGVAQERGNVLHKELRNEDQHIRSVDEPENGEPLSKKPRI